MNDILDAFSNSEKISFIKHFEFARRCAKYLREPLTEGLARQLVINVLDHFDKVADEKSQEIWADVIEATGFYPYLEKEQERLTLINTAAEIRKEFHWSGLLDVYLHDEQLFFRDFLFRDEKNLILSAPTSFGKSLLIQEIVASRKFKNLVIIQPTLALLEETRRNLNKYRQFYKIIVRTTQEPSTQKGNLFLLTAERVMEYENFPPIDFFVLDEFYKLSPKMDPSRSDILNNAFNLLANGHKSRFYMLGPNIDEIPPGFEKRYNAKFFNTNYTLVDTQEIDKTSYEYTLTDEGLSKKQANLFDLLYSLALKKEQTIIYCSSPRTVRKLARKFCDYLEAKNVSPRMQELTIVEWIKKNVDERWGLIRCINQRIGIHDGVLEKHMTASIMRYFNEGELSYLFCTTTIIEGVNTTAKNVVYFDNKKGKDDIVFFDYSNIKGRSGRLMKHYVGRVFNYNKPPDRERIKIRIPIFDQLDIKEEVLINIPDEDVINRHSEAYQFIWNLPEAEQALFRNNGVSIRGQKIILDRLIEELDFNYKLLTWDEPSFEQLDYVLHLAWDNLRRQNDGHPMNKKILTPITFQYGKTKSVIPIIVRSFRTYLKWRDSPEKKFDKFKKLVKGKSDEDLLDEAITRAYTFQRKWFHYTIPKWLTVMSNLQNYVFDHYASDLKAKGVKPGSYTFYAANMENDFVRENLAILAEYGIPKSAIDKLGKKLPKDISEDEILEAIKNARLLDDANLIAYEREKIDDLNNSKTF